MELIWDISDSCKNLINLHFIEKFFWNLYFGTMEPL